MVFITKYLQQIKISLFSTTRLLCKITSRSKRKHNNDIIGKKNDLINKMSEKVDHRQQKEQIENQSIYQVDRNNTNHQANELAVRRCRVDAQKPAILTRTDCASPSRQVTQSFRSVSPAVDSQILPPYILNEEDNLSAKHIHQSPIYEHPNHHDKRELYSTLKRLLQPYKTFYEVEWTFPNYANATTSKIWLQMDRQTSSGIERVRKLGFSNLDVRLDDKLTRYINKSVLFDRKIENILIEIMFSHWHDNRRKDSMLQCSNTSSHIVERNKEEGSHYRQNMHLLRLRRVHWWTIDYHFARATCLSSSS